MTEKRKNKGNFPNLRFPEFTEGWEVKKLGEVSEINPKNSNLPSSFIYVDLESVNNGILIKETNIFKSEAPSRAQRLLEKKDVLFQMVRPYQKNNFYFNLDGNYVASTGYAQIRTKHNSQFIFQHIHNQRFVDKVIERCTGTSYPAINSTDLSKITISFPSKAEQDKIASLFLLIDERILHSMKIIKNLESLMAGFREKIFSQKIRFKDENGGDFPDWEIFKLKNVARIFDGTHQTPKYVENGIPFYSVENVTANDFTNTKFISEDVFFKENIRVKIENGDILMTRIGDIGTARYIDWSVNASFYVSLALIKKSDNYNSKYLTQYIACNKFQNEMWNRTIHVAFPKKINLGEIGECLVELPTIKEQIKIANFLSTMSNKIEIEKKLLEELETQKKYLLSNLFI